MCRPAAPPLRHVKSRWFRSSSARFPPNSPSPLPCPTSCSGASCCRSWSSAIVGFVLRIYDVGSRALHHDESLHAVYSWYLYIGRGYVHDPLMHGPYQFHVPALLYFLFGASDVTARLAAVLHGTGIIILPYFLRHELGRRGAIVASLLFTISPAFLYFSRFMREDIYLAFYTLGMVVGIFGWIRTRQNRWLYWGSFSLICAFADKEATYIHGFTFVTFFVFLWASAPLQRPPIWPIVWNALKAIDRRTWIACVAIFVVIYVLLFSTFFTNLGDPWNCLQGRGCSKGGLWSGSIGALAYWIEQHDVQRGGQPFYYYVLLLGLYEFVPVIFAVAAVASAWFRRSLFGLFCAWWFLGNFVIYSWAGEKMPWLLPHVAMPLVLLAATLAGRLVRAGDAARPVLAAVFARGRAGAGSVHDADRVPGARGGPGAEPGPARSAVDGAGAVHARRADAGGDRRGGVPGGGAPGEHRDAACGRRADRAGRVLRPHVVDGDVQARRHPGRDAGLRPVVAGHPVGRPRDRADRVPDGAARGAADPDGQRLHRGRERPAGRPRGGVVAVRVVPAGLQEPPVLQQERSLRTSTSETTR